MQELKAIISSTAPKIKAGIWIKPVEEGHVVYILNNGVYKPLKVVDDKGTSSIEDDEVVNPEGDSSQVIFIEKSEFESLTVVDDNKIYIVYEEADDD